MNKNTATLATAARTRRTRDDAIAAFLKARDQAIALHNKLGRYLEDFMDVPADNVTWGNVGDANRLTAALAEIAEWTGLK